MPLSDHVAARSADATIEEVLNSAKKEATVLCLVALTTSAQGQLLGGYGRFSGSIVVLFETVSIVHTDVKYGRFAAARWWLCLTGVCATTIDGLPYFAVSPPFATIPTVLSFVSPSSRPAKFSGCLR